MFSCLLIKCEISNLIKFNKSNLKRVLCLNKIKMNCKYCKTIFKSTSALNKTLRPKNVRVNYLSVKNNADVGNNLVVKNNANIKNILEVGTTQLLRSKNIVTSEGFTVGASPTKDMDREDYRDEFDPYNYQQDFFPGMADFIDTNIVAGDKSSENRLLASYWNDLGNDVFDEWGYFYLYDVESEKYYFPLITPRNQDNGVITTQTFRAFGRNFTIAHGWPVQGIFKFDISVDDDKLFRFGAYGDMGSDGDEVLEQLTQSYTVNGNNLTLYYHHHQEDSDNTEQLYSYFIPKKVSENNDISSYNFYNDNDENSMISKEVSSGLLVYFSKANNVKDWVINDIDTEYGSSYSTLITGNEYVKGNILSTGSNLGRLTLTRSISDADYTPPASLLINGYFTNAQLSENRSFIIPSASDIVSAIPNCSSNTSFRFTINNICGAPSYNRVLSTYDESVTIDPSCLNTNIFENSVFSYIVLITDVRPESESVVILQDSPTNIS
jgi:hypothetical protein